MSINLLRSKTESKELEPGPIHDCSLDLGKINALDQ